MLSNYKFKIKESFHNKSTMFFSFIFPIVLITLFHLTISRIDSSEIFNTIQVSIENEEIAEIMKDIEVSKGKKLFEIIDSKNYKKDLKSDKIKAYIQGEDDLKVIVSDNDVNATIVYETVNRYNHVNKIYGKVMASDMNINVDEITKVYNEENKIVNKFDSSNKQVSLLYFFPVLAMTCLSASNLGVDIGEILNPKSDMEYVKRILISPVNKFKLLLSSFLGTLTFSLLVTYITIIQMIILKVPIYDYLLPILLSATFGTVLGVFQGMLISAIFNVKLTVKYNINAGFYVFSSFLAGMMSHAIPYIVDRALPIIKYINPASVITNTFKSIYYFESNERFLLGVGNMILLIITFIFITMFIYRRKKHANI
ncbi:ABC transporter permease [Peptostreptococcaceae bacterium OttesenSCG-928-C18]|nr:ABC transporter permease [Peptostreptococcaceae bacterium OttesenSCG-928-C18]